MSLNSPFLLSLFSFFLFLFSFPFKIPAISSQQEVSIINVSQQFFSFFSFFLSFFFFYLRKCLSRWTGACNKVHSLIYCWWNRFLSISLFLFLNTYNFPICRKGRRKTVQVVLIFDEVECSFLYGRVTSIESAESASFSANFCPKTFPRVGCKSAFFSRQLLSQTKDSFPNFSNGKMAFWH